MNRVIKFRAQKTTNAIWVYGSLVHTNEKDATIHFQTEKGFLEYVFVKPDTIGQFTGLHDINGKEIYEGDIVTMKRTPKGRSMSVTSRHVVKSHSVTDWNFHSLAKEVLSYSMYNFHEEYSIYNNCVEVIGNIYDNPELAKPYSLNLPEPKQRKKRNKPFKIEFIVKD